MREAKQIRLHLFAATVAASVSLLSRECKVGCGCVGRFVKFAADPDLLGKYIGSLLHEGADSEPHGVFQVEIIFQFLRIRVARMRIVPFAWRHPVDKEIPLTILPLNPIELFLPFLHSREFNFIIL